MLAIYPNCIDITSPVSSIAPGVFGAGRQGVGLNPSAPTVNCFYVLSETDLILTDAYLEGIRGVAIETARYAAV